MLRNSLFATLLLVASGAQAAESSLQQPVCSVHSVLVNNFAMAQAKAVVTRVFARANVQIVWLSSAKCSAAGSNVLRLEMDAAVPAVFGPETMGYAMPYGSSGTSIHIFFERVTQDHRDMPGLVLGYVMAHEIGHVLEGIARHSDGGLMMSHWSYSEYAQMRKTNLGFAAEDVELIQAKLQRAYAAGLAARSGVE